VNQLALAIHRNPDLNGILELATSETVKALGADRGILLRLKYWDPIFLTRGREEFPRARVVVACEVFNFEGQVDQEQPLEVKSATDDEFNHQAFWLSECALCRRGFSQPSQLVTVANSNELQEVAAGESVASTFRVDERSALLLAPLESQGTVLGFLVFQHTQPHPWKPEEIQLVELVQAQVSTAIIQTETLRQVQALVEKRTAELRESLSVQAKLYELTRQQVDQLRRLNRLKDEFLSTVSHELRTPLTSMRMAIRMLRQAGIDSDRGDHYLNILEQQCIQEANLVNDLLALQELESDQMQIQLEELDMKQLLEELAILFREQWAAKGLVLDLTLPMRSLWLWSDRDSISRIFLELLTNAGKYSDPGSHINLTLALAPDSSENIVVTLSNIGAGIAADELPYIFDKFHRGQGATQNAIQGTGLGLSLVKSLLQHIGGAIEVSSQLLDSTTAWKTCFTVRLPQQMGTL
jgi:signal transduction histidine kinase